MQGTLDTCDVMISLRPRIEKVLVYQVFMNSMKQLRLGTGRKADSQRYSNHVTGSPVQRESDVLYHATTDAEIRFIILVILARIGDSKFYGIILATDWMDGDRKIRARIPKFISSLSVNIDYTTYYNVSPPKVTSTGRRTWARERVLIQGPPIFCGLGRFTQQVEGNVLGWQPYLRCVGDSILNHLVSRLV
uniref:Uncharacterized protein n=1 Tax=Timema douglasi TaxID=61478 RepID=A0A7R8VNG2_TIMDO|nr:unnamed protein product [Timema douglasi]